MAAPRLHGSRRALPATLVEVAEHRLRDAILSGALQPGDKIVEEQLCADFGISMAPLREALRLLTQQGLVEHLPRRGSRVAEWSPSDILQLFALRHVLERPPEDRGMEQAVGIVAVQLARGRTHLLQRQLGQDRFQRDVQLAVAGRVPARAKDPVEVDESDVVAGH